MSLKKAILDKLCEVIDHLTDITKIVIEKRGEYETFVELDGTTIILASQKETYE